MKAFLIVIFNFLFLININGQDVSAIENKKTIDSLQSVIYELRNDVNNSQNLLKSAELLLAQSNSSINTYLRFTGIIASIFGVLIALSGIFLGFESLKAQNSKKQAIKTLEEAKNYVNTKKSDFDNLIVKVKNEIDIDHQKILKISKEKIIADIDAELLEVKSVAKSKTREIQEISIEKESHLKLDQISQRIEMIESIGMPDDPKILLSKAKILSKKELHSEAIKLLKLVIEKENSNSSAFWQLGWENSKLKNHEESIKYYSKAIEINPKDDSALNNMGVEYGRMDKLLDALSQYELAINISPSKILYHGNRINTLKKLKSIEKVIGAYDKLLEIDNSSNNYWELAKYLHSNNKTEESIEYLSISISNHDEENQDEISGLKYQKAYYLKEIEKYDESVQIYQELIDLNYKQDDCYLWISQIHFDKNETEEAFKILDNAIGANPKSLRLYLRKVNFLIDNDIEKAKEIVYDASSNIEGEGLFQSAAREFTKKVNFEVSKEFYLKTLEIIEPKLKENKEGDILNYFEGLIITEQHKKAQKFVSDKLEYINSDKYKAVKKYLDIASDLRNKDFKVYNKQQDIELLEKHATEIINWNFEDVTNWLGSIDTEKQKYMIQLSKFISQKITKKELIASI